jgi:hypothetical protein
MMPAKKIILFLGVFAIGFPLFSQTISVKKETARIKSEYADGFEVSLEGSTLPEVESALNKFMKSLGKTKQVENYRMVNEPDIKGKSYTTPVFGMVKQLGNIISVWVGIKTKDWGDDAETVNKDLETMMHDFGVIFQREKIQKQIDESVRAEQAVERQQQRLVNQSQDLNNKIENNKREKIQLEKSLENNKIELETLIQRLEQNKKDQDSVAIAGEQIKKVIEMHKERQNKVN